MKREIYASVTERGQVTIPAEVRKALGISPRSKVIFTIEGDKDVSISTPRFTLESLRGSVPPLGRKLTWKEMRRIAHEEKAAETMQEMSRE